MSQGPDAKCRPAAGGDAHHIRVATSIAEIDAKKWNVLVRGMAEHGAGRGNPFVSHEYLSALEGSGSATADSGWLGQHMLLETADGELIAALPGYLKNHSQGEYVFDHGWADAFERAGGRYYPKLQCSVPFTPASGPRFLVRNTEMADQYRQALASGLQQLGEKLGVSSAHITFMQEEEWRALDDTQFLKRTDQQFHWLNQGYATFEEFLEQLSSRKRKAIRRERRGALADSNIVIERLSGDDLSEVVWDRFFEFYVDTGARKWGSPYLTRDFFSMIGETMADRIVLIMAKRFGRYIAGAINFVGDGTLYGRHWGCIEDHPFLHFEICYYQAIEHAIDCHLARVEAGAQGAHKLARGYMPVITYSAHWIAHPGLRHAVANYLEQERQYVAMENDALARHGPFRNSDE